MMALAAAPAEGPKAMDEYLILSKLTRLALTQVTWPGKPKEEALKMAVVGGSEFGNKLDKVFEQGTIGGRTTQITYLSIQGYLEEKQHFDVLFLQKGWGGEEYIGAVLRKTQNRPVLIMGYADGLLRRSLMMNFYLEGSRMHFEINPNRIKEARLTISSYLMNLAKIVDS
jgi:hypothetical protein